jgi:hypothetical protein
LPAQVFEIASDGVEVARLMPLAQLELVFIWYADVEAGTHSSISSRIERRGFLTQSSDHRLSDGNG